MKVILHDVEVFKVGIKYACERRGDELDCDGNFTVEIKDGVTNLECSYVFHSSDFWYWAKCVEAIKGKRLAELVLDYFGDDYFELVSYKVKEG